jgi:hydroxyacylglutathione hydrolase
MKSWETKSGSRIIRILSGRSNAFLVLSNNINVLVDTGPGRLWHKLKRNLDDYNIQSIDYLILTHTHFDHAGNAARIAREFGAKVIVNKEEALFLEKGENTMISGTTLYGRLVVKLLSHTAIAKNTYESCSPDLVIDQGYTVTGNKEIFIIHTPGHSPGSQSVIIGNEIALVGDTMFGILPRSILPPFATDVFQINVSWGKLLKTDCMLFLPSHGTANKRKLVEVYYKKYGRAMSYSI